MPSPFHYQTKHRSREDSWEYDAQLLARASGFFGSSFTRREVFLGGWNKSRKTWCSRRLVAQPIAFDELHSVLTGDETLCQMLDRCCFSNKMILKVKDAKMSSSSSDFQTHITHQFPLYFLYELLMTLWRMHETQRRYLDAKSGEYLFNC